MNTYWTNPRHVGWTAAGLLVIATLLTWITFSGPFIGSLSVTGIETDDGRLALGFAVVLALIAVFASRMWLGICGVLAAAYYGYEFFHVASFDLADEADPRFEGFARAFTINPGLGIYLGLATGLALIGWGLVYPYVQTRRTPAAPADEPAGSPSE